MTAEKLGNIQQETKRFASQLSDKQLILTRAKELYAEQENRPLSIAQVNKDYNKFVSLPEHLANREFEDVDNIDDIIDEADTLMTILGQKCKPKELEGQISEAFVQTQKLLKVLEKSK